MTRCFGVRQAAASCLSVVTLVLLGTTVFLPVAGAESGDVVRVGLPASGTFRWVLHAIEYFGIDEERVFASKRRRSVKNMYRSFLMGTPAIADEELAALGVDIL